MTDTSQHGISLARIRIQRYDTPDLQAYAAANSLPSSPNQTGSRPSRSASLTCRPTSRPGSPRNCQRRCARSGRSSARSLVALGSADRSKVSAARTRGTG
jgi:hypothetical protein